MQGGDVDERQTDPTFTTARRPDGTRTALPFDPSYSGPGEAIAWA